MSKISVDSEDVKAVLSFLEDIEEEDQGSTPASIRAVAEHWWYKVYPLAGPRRKMGRKY